MITLEPVNAYDGAHRMRLYMLLDERTPQQAISHKAMPTYAEHCAFVMNIPYKAWYLIVDPVDGHTVGATYLSKQNEIGIFIFNHFQGQGYAADAVAELMRLHDGPFLANINPMNTRSVRFFQSLGFKPLQVTYSHE